jgi:hypothetical protein
LPLLWLLVVEPEVVVVDRDCLSLPLPLPQPMLMTLLLLLLMGLPAPAELFAVIDRRVMTLAPLPPLTLMLPLPLALMHNTADPFDCDGDGACC